jgi:hypothetical protein
MFLFSDDLEEKLINQIIRPPRSTYDNSSLGSLILQNSVYNMHQYNFYQIPLNQLIDSSR